ncbi:MAG: pentapeptide repeat-containing protein [Hormoscilla sp.]
MKAKKLLQLYAEGRRDFRGENLRGQSFKGKNLSGADFSGADIRGANFTNAYLLEAKFVGAKAGLQKRWAISLVLIIWLFSGIFGILSMAGGACIGLIMSQEVENIIAGWVSLVIIVILWIIVIREKEGAYNAYTFSHLIAVIGIATQFVVILVVGIATQFNAVGIATGFARAGSISFAALVVVCNFFFVFFFAFMVAAALAVAGTVAGIGTVAVNFAPILAIFRTGIEARGEAEAGTIILSAIGVLILLSSYIGWRAMAGDPRNAGIRAFAIELAAIWGTNFYRANLTDADFTNAILKSTDMMSANLTRTCLKNAIKLEVILNIYSYPNH